MPFKNILACVDFTDISDAVVNSAALLSKVFDAKINLLTVIERPVPILHEGFEEFIEPEEIEILFELEKKLREDAEEKLNRYSQDLYSKNIKVKTIIEISENITDSILDNIEKEKADLVIIGSHKKGLIDKLLLGSISEKIVNKSPVSTLVLKGQEIKNLKKLLVGYDFLPNSKEALNIAEEIAQKCNSEIFIVHADTDIKHTHILSVYNSVKEKKKNILNQIVSEIKNKGINAKYEILEESPVEAILDEIEEYHPDLTIVGKRKSSKLRRLFLGTTALKIVKNAPSPVLIVRKGNE